MTSTTAQPRRTEEVAGLQFGSEGANHIEAEAALDALNDPDCRTLLEATTEVALTARELIERCGIPRSTTYRKVEQLTEAGLLEEEVRISPDGKHASEYRRAFEDIVVSISPSEGVEVGRSRS